MNPGGGGHPPSPPESTLCKNKNSNFSALELDRDLGFSRGPSNIGGPVAATEHSFLFTGMLDFFKYK